MNIQLKLSVPKLSKEELNDILITCLPKKFKVKSIRLPLKPGAGRRRGNKWELDFCKDLSNWWTGYEDNGVFKRAGSTHSVDKGHVFGDVYAVKSCGFPLTDKIAIELKVVKETRLETANLLCGKSKMFSSFWEQAVRQAELGDRHPVLVVKMDRHCTLVFNLLDTVGELCLSEGGNKIPMCTLDDWFDLDANSFNLSNII
jgi:hypothetical protein